MINRTITEDAVNMTCKMTTNNGMTATSRNTTDNDNTTTGHTTTADGETVNPNTNTFTTLKHIGLNAKGFKQSSLYIAELLSDADTVSISETWLRPGELCIIKSTLMNTPALNVLSDEDRPKDPKWRLGDKCLCNEESLNILGNVFNQGGNNASHVTNRLTKCRQSFYGLGNAGMLYPGATPGVQAYLYKCICQPTLTYGLECMGSTAIQMRRNICKVWHAYNRSLLCWQTLWWCRCGL